MLIARNNEVFPLLCLLCLLCGGHMRIIAFITYSADIRQILEHIGVESEPPHMAPARGAAAVGWVLRSRGMTVCISNQNGIWRHNRPRTTR